MTKKYFFLFVMMMFINFIFLENVNASQISCSYQGEIDKVGKYTVTVGLDDKGNLAIKETKFNDVCAPGDTYCQEKNTNDPNAMNKISLESKITVNDFVSGNDMVVICPSLYASAVVKRKIHVGDFGVEQQVRSDTVLYIGTTQASLTSDVKKGTTKLDKNNFKTETSVGKPKSMKLIFQTLNRGEKFYLKGKVLNNNAGKVCKYKSAEGSVSGYTATIRTVGSRSWVLSSTQLGTAGAAIIKYSGNAKDTRCISRVYVKCRVDTSNNSRICTVSTKSSGGLGEVKLVSDTSSDTEDGDYDDAGKVHEITPTNVSGCAMWGSLLTFLNGYVYGTIKFALVGLLIVMGMLDFSKAVFAADDAAIKKAAKKFAIRVLIVVLFFMLPIIIETILNWFLPGETIKTCLESFK